MKEIDTPIEFNEVYLLFDQHQRTNRTKIVNTVVLTFIIILIPFFLCSQSQNPAKEQEKRTTFSLFNNSFNLGNVTRTINEPSLEQLISKEFVDVRNTIDSNLKVIASLHQIPEKTDPLYVDLQPIINSSIEFPREIRIKTESLNQPYLEDLYSSMLKEYYFELRKYRIELQTKLGSADRSKKSSVKTTKTYKTHFSEEPYIVLLTRLFFFVLLFYFVLYLSRLLRYYIKVGNHYKERKLAIQLSEKLKISLEEALIITSTSYIDFIPPRIPIEVLTHYYTSKNQTTSGCCYCCHEHCKCKEPLKQTNQS